MKKLIIALLITLVAYTTNAQTVAKKITQLQRSPVGIKKTATAVKSAPNVVAIKAPLFKNNLDSVSYALGLNEANKYLSGGLNKLNYDLFAKGLKDAFVKANPLLTPEQCQASVNKLLSSLNKEKESENMSQYGPNIKAGADFLAANKVKPGIKTTASGLQYEVITQGTGNRPVATDQVTVNYKGTLLDGTEFDSSYKRNEPATFGLNQVISGWTEGLQLMQEGSKYRFFVPYNLAYGGRATPDGSIPPFSTLIFEVELLKIGQ